MESLSWVKELPVAVTVCDPDGRILEMNDKSCQVFAKEGGKDLIGKNVLDCHPAPARAKLQDMLKNRQLNCYTIEKNGIKKLIYQTPWYSEGNYMGIVEMIIEIPADMPHFKR